MSGYPDSLIYYMWGWQVHFRISCQIASESLFNKLDTGLRPNVFFIGFLTKNDENRPPICLEPEDLSFSLDEFDKIQEIADNLYENDPDRNMLYSGDGMQEEMDGRRKRKSFRVALENILNGSPNNYGSIHFVSYGVPVDGYNVFIILSLNKNVYNGHLVLKNVDANARVRKYYSLVETAKVAFLNEKVRVLQMPNPGENLSLDARDSEELLREAARNFTYTIAWAGNNPEGIHLLFDSCQKISIARYERAESFGHLIIAERNNRAIEMTLEIERPFNINDIRKSRKMLELSDKNIGVICNSAQILGLGKIKDDYDSLTESVFNIYFNGLHCWEVSHNNQILFQMRYGLPQLPNEIVNREQFFSDAKRVFLNINEEQLNNLFDLCIIVTGQKKGAMLVIVDDAFDEAKRLDNQCINIKPVKLERELLLNLTLIDGAVIVDLNGVAYAKAVILDGIVGLNGDSSRGSRYNSALTYQEYRGLNKPTMIVVVSEDGMVDIIPTLKPQIKHSEIQQVLSILEKLNSAASFDSSAFYDSMKWLENRQFYLTQQECDKINELKNSLEDLDRNSGEKTMWRVFENLIPDPRMNETYYLNES